MDKMLRGFLLIAVLCVLSDKSFALKNGELKIETMYKHEDTKRWNRNLTQICNENERRKNNCQECVSIVFETTESFYLHFKDFTLSDFENSALFMYLEKVRIEGATFKQLTKNPKEKLLSLTELEFVRNNKSDFDFSKAEFPIFKALSRLRIKKNTFKKVSKNKFVTEKFPVLETLRLVENGIEKFEQQELERLTFLDLSNNKIESFEKGVFDKMPALYKIDLYGNRLKSGLTFKRHETPKNKEDQEDRFVCQCDYELETANGFSADSHGHFVCDDKRGCIGCNIKNQIYFVQYEQRIRKMNDMDSLDEFCPMRVKGSSHRLSAFESLKRTKVLEIIVQVMFFLLLATSLGKKNTDHEMLNTILKGTCLLVVLMASVWSVAVLQQRRGFIDLQSHLLQVTQELSRVGNVVISLMVTTGLLHAMMRNRHMFRNRKLWLAAAAVFALALGLGLGYF